MTETPLQKALRESREREKNRLSSEQAHALFAGHTLFMEPRFRRMVEVAVRALEFAEADYRIAKNIPGTGIDYGAVCRKAIEALAELNRLAEEKD